MKPLDNKSEYLVIYDCDDSSIAKLVDAKFNQIGEFNADSDTVSALLERSRMLGTVDTSDWDGLFSDCSPEERRLMTAYRIHE
jgi:hypothetical protein